MSFIHFIGACSALPKRDPIITGQHIYNWRYEIHFINSPQVGLRHRKWTSWTSWKWTLSGQICLNFEWIIPFSSKVLKLFFTKQCCKYNFIWRLICWGSLYKNDKTGYTSKSTMFHNKRNQMTLFMLPLAKNPKQ